MYSKQNLLSVPGTKVVWKQVKFSPELLLWKFYDFPILQHLIQPTDYIETLLSYVCIALYEGRVKL